jgi:uncharacterized protein (DUF302 family)
LGPERLTTFRAFFYKEKLEMDAVSLLIGFLAGGLVAGLAVWKFMPGLMITIHPSKLSVDETVAGLEKAALDRKWKVPKIYDIQKTLQDSGFSDMTPLKILSICQPAHAYNILQDDKDKIVTAIMPCRMAVYQGKDGKAYIAEMNMGLMTKMFGGNIARIMGKVAIEEKEMVEPFIAR